MEKKILIQKDTIQAKVKELAGQISSDYADKEPVLIGILKGVIFFFADLVREMAIPCKIDFIRASSYGSDMTSSGVITLTKDIEIPIKDKPVIIIEDLVDTGLTLKHIFKKLEEKAPESIKICALINKLERRNEEIVVDYCGFQIKEGFL
ncbi:MAG: hypoxanthine phosphoribosyltransferase, partial [Thermodesulfobacteriota bacterium]|nr:hypoxanthine phosphoribosyltransferase [Thermodesulfobacteriota bacterium]